MSLDTIATKSPSSPGGPGSTSATSPGQVRRVLRWLLLQREASLIGFVLVFAIGMTIYTPDFPTIANFKAIALGMATTAIVAIGMTVLLVSGGFDLSVGSVLALGGLVAGKLLVAGQPVAVAVLVALAAGALCGLINGIVVARIGINPLIQTLGMMGVVRGLDYLLGGGFGIAGLKAPFTDIGQDVWLGVQAPIFYMLVLVVVGDFLLRRSRVLRQVYYIGGNERSARLAGIRVERMKVGAYLLSGLLAALAGVIDTSRFGTASVSAGSGLELTVIAAVVIGGASLSGGTGTVLGAALGVLLTGLINNALNLIGVAVYWQSIAIGLVLILAVGVDAATRRLRSG